MHLLPVFPDLKAGPVVFTGTDELLRALSRVLSAGAPSRQTLKAINP